MKMKALCSSALLIVSFLITLCIILFLSRSIWFIMHATTATTLICGNSLTSPLLLALNTFVPFGFFVHIAMVALFFFTQRTLLLPAILQTLVFVSVSVSLVLLGKCISIVWMEGFPLLYKSVWWLF